VLAVDDELPALEDLVRLLEASPTVERVESAASAEEALVALGDGAAIDAVFLDVRMPGLGGLELARVLRRFEQPPAVVFVSAFDDAAVDAFELAAVDYLRKTATLEDETVAVDVPRGGTRLIARSSVLYLQAHGDYVRVASTEGRYLVRARLSDLEERWAGHGFVRVHRGFVVNLRRAVEVRPRLNGTAVLVMTDGGEVPIARRQVGELRRKLGV
jgi:DNA-binding LytR/AlgR family response regulator